MSPGALAMRAAAQAEEVSGKAGQAGRRLQASGAHAHCAKAANNDPSSCEQTAPMIAITSDLHRLELAGLVVLATSAATNQQ
eukprot:2018197-Lingulodinium_polyedra.AAC.1